MVSKFPRLGVQVRQKDRRFHGSEGSLFGIPIARLRPGFSLYRVSDAEKRAMKHLSIIVVLIPVCLMLTGVASAQDKAQLERGMKAYADQKCSICHAIDGKGNAKGTLDGVGAKLKADEIREWLVNPVEMATKAKADRKPVMKAYASLSKEDLDALVAYLSSLKKKS